MNHPRRASLL